MKRVWSVLLLLSLLLALSACGGQQNTETTAAPSETQTEISDSQETVPDSAVIDNIRSRGYLIAGCKMDVRGLSYYDKANDLWSGLEIEIAYMTAAKIFKVDINEAKAKNLVRFVGVTVADREEKLQNGEIDVMLATFTITEERAELFALSNPYYKDYIGLMVLYSGENPNSLGTGEIRSIADLDGKNVGVAKNSTTREDMIRYLNTMNSISVNPMFFEYASYEAMFKALKEGTIDVMSVDVSILSNYVDNETQILGDRFAGQNYGAAVLPENADILTYINQAIEDIS